MHTYIHTYTHIYIVILHVLICHIYILYIYINWGIGLMSRVFVNGPRDCGSIPGRVILIIIIMIMSCRYHGYLNLSRLFSLSFIASGRSSGLHPVFSHSCCMYVRAGRPAFAWTYAGVHRSTSLMSSSLLLQQRPACLVRLAWIVFVMGGRWPYSWRLMGCCRQHLFNIASNILV